MHGLIRQAGRFPKLKTPVEKQGFLINDEYVHEENRLESPEEFIAAVAGFRKARFH
jgi:hypothetical protein